MISNERIVFRLIHMECCGHILCWVNPRFPSFCPQCGATVYPAIKSWVTSKDDNATLKINLGKLPVQTDPTDKQCGTSSHPGTSRVGFRCIYLAGHPGEHNFGSDYAKHMREHG